MNSLRRVFLGLALSLAVGWGGSAGAAEAKQWGYEGGDGPDHWGQLSPAFAACALGKEQSPVDIRNAVPAKPERIAIHYGAQRLAIINNGHTIQVNLKPGNFIEVDGKRYDLVQYHFHHPSEHANDGAKTPMELHLVHRNKQSGKLAVLAVMMVAGKANPTIEELWEAMPSQAGPEKKVSKAVINPRTLLPTERDHFRYEGSLTTPPCSEAVQWIAFKTPIELSEAQIDRFAALFPMNARPLQPIDGRVIGDVEQPK